MDLSDPRLVTSPLGAARAAAAAVDPWALPAPSPTALRAAIAEATGLPPAAVFVTRGAEAALGAICQLLLRDGDRAVVCSPSWPSLTRSILVAGARYVELGRDQHMAPRLDNLARVLEDQRPRLAILTDPDPVTGCRVQGEVYERLREAGVTAVVDRSCALLLGPTPFRLMGADGEAPEAYADGAPALVVVDSLSVRAGLGADPVGWALGPPAVVAALERAFPVCPVSGPARAAARAVLEDRAGLEATARSCEDRQRRLRELLLEEQRTSAPAAGGTGPLRVSDSHGPTVWLGYRGTRAAQLAETFWRAGVRVAAQPEDPSWHEGISLTAPRQVDLPRALQAVRRALHHLRRGAGEGGQSGLGALLALALPLLTSTALGFAGGCGAPGPSSPPAAAQGRGAQEARAPVVSPAPRAAVPPSSSRPTAAQRRQPPRDAPVGVWKPLHRAPLVGGCGRACATPAGALRGFLQGLARGDAPDGGQPRVDRFLNTAVLRVDGGSQGEELSDLWRRGALGRRARRVQAIVRDLARGLVPEARASLTAAADAALPALRAGPREAHVTVEVPPLGTAWRVSLARRGLEWLVVSVDRR